MSRFDFALVADLHFGSVPDGLAAALLDDLSRTPLDLVIVAGDLTMRARRREFDAAREWIGAIKTKTMVLVGNHDLPYWNLWERFVTPYRRFTRSAGTEPEPVFENGAAVIASLNTTRSWQPHLAWQEGVARKLSVLTAAEKLVTATPPVFRAIASHHPLWRGPKTPSYVRPAIGGGKAVGALAEVGAELFMSGHVHRGFVDMFEAGGRKCVALGSPTALSARLRGEENGYWRVSVNAAEMAFTLRRRSGETFSDERLERAKRA
jgi:3',5'-cyclic AMP phosphodiesterase CpdA